MNIPKSWDEVTLEQFIDLNNINYDEYESTSSIHLERLSILTDIPVDDESWDDMDIRKLNKLVGECGFINKLPRIKAPKSIFDGKYHKMDLNTITFGAFIDLEFFTNDNYITNAHKIIAVIYRQNKIGDWDETIVEPYGNINFTKRSNEILYDGMLSDGYGVIQDYLEWRNIFYKNYQPLFEGEIEDDYNRDDLDSEELAELEEIEAEEARMKKWGWERLALSVADGDITKIAEVFEMPLLLIFNMLSMKKDLKID